VTDIPANSAVKGAKLMSRPIYTVGDTKSTRERPNTPANRSKRLAPSVDADIHRERRPHRPHNERQRLALLALRARLQGNVTRTADTVLSGVGIESACASPDAADCASEIIEQNLAVSLLGSATDTLEKIDLALRRIEEGSYGRCLECDARIPPTRLEAIPYATACVQCAARQERVQ
jgi:DnaK suppressor protein